MPSGHNSRVPLPLLLVLAGRGKSLQETMSESGFSSGKTADSYIAAYLEGNISPSKHQGWATFGPNDPETNDVAYVLSVTAALEINLCIDTGRVYVVGSSNGAGMAGVLACSATQYFAGAAMVSGLFYPLPLGCHPSEPLPVFEIHDIGDQDALYFGAVWAQFTPIPNWLSMWAAIDGCNTDSPVTHKVTGRPSYTLVSYRGCIKGSAVSQELIYSNHHGWSQPVGRPGVPDEAQSIWRFLSLHNRS